MSSSIEGGIFAVTVCEGHQNKRLASRAGENEGVTFLHLKCTKHTTAHRDGSPYLLRIRQMPRAKRVGRTVSVSRRGELAFFDFFVDYVVPYFEVTGKGMSAETPMKTLGKSSSIGSPIGSSKTPLENMVNTTQEAREKTREKILGLVCASANISTDEMASQLGITRKGIEWHIRKLKAENILHRIGPDKGGHWEVLK